MAGAGYKLFNTGDVLTAAQVNTYLQEQTVMVFASSAARTSALSGVLAEGMMSYLQDTNSVEVYNGTSWVNVGNAGDITEVQAGVGISVASGTGPIPVITNSSTDLITTAGDLLYGTAADTVARLGIGTAGQVLTVNSGATAPQWAAAASGGKVVQIVSATHATETSNSTNVLADTGLTATITPSSASNKILVFANLMSVRKSPGNANNQIQLALLRGATVINSSLGLYTGTAIDNGVPSAIFIANDAPNTTSATTYKMQFCNFNNSASVSINYNDSFVDATSVIILMEVTP